MERFTAEWYGICAESKDLDSGTSEFHAPSALFGFTVFDKL